jgi:integrase
MKRAFDKGFLRRPIKIDRQTARESKGRVIEEDEIKRLLVEANETLRVQIVMALTMGMRRSEILKLTWDRVDMKKRIIKLRAIDTKTRRAREFPISPQSFVMLQNIQGEDPRGPVFPSRLDDSAVMKDNKTAWQACKKRAQVECRFHDLRHTFLTKAFRQNVNPALICDYAGLSMSVAQKVYLHFTSDDKKDVANLVSFGE